ncbi:hypothetical protein CDAR_177471 [Caerostris darwini]|uniref:Uncharacterized protein n=1 Tax=Caerostris darwini TaxID=1538125 RepID=A0AAV4P5B9_9ARAC|nr:hypothetical protein CDAR_177471 [Caerostris darwini]
MQRKNKNNKNEQQNNNNGHAKKHQSQTSRTPKTRETVSLSAHGTKHIESNAVLFITVACLTGPKVGGGGGWRWGDKTARPPREFPSSNGSWGRLHKPIISIKLGAGDTMD